MKHPRRPRPGHIYSTPFGQSVECLNVEILHPPFRIRVRFPSGYTTHFTTNYPLTPASLRQQRDFWYQSYRYLADKTRLETPQ